MSRMNISEPRRCSACGGGSLTPKKDTQQVEYNGAQGTIPLYYAVCDACGSEIAAEGEAKANKRAMTAFRKYTDGLLTGAEMRDARRAMGLTQAQAAQLFGGGKVAFSRYENNDITQSEAMDSLVRLCRDVSANVERVAEQKSVALGVGQAGQNRYAAVTSSLGLVIKQRLERQIGGHPADTSRLPVNPLPKIVDLQRYRKSVA